MGKKSALKRKKILVKKSFQFAYVGKILLIELIAVSTTALLVSYLFLYVFNDATMVSTGPWGKGILLSTCVLAIILVVILFWLGLRISHKIAGPMYRFETTFREVQNGNLNARVYLRDGDEMKPLANAFNAMLDVVSEKVRQNHTGEYKPETMEERLRFLIATIGKSPLPANDKDRYRKVLESLKSKL